MRKRGMLNADYLLYCMLKVHKLQNKQSPLAHSHHNMQYPTRPIEINLRYHVTQHAILFCHIYIRRRLLS